MAKGDNDPSDAEDGPILSPDELDITQDEHVAEIDDGRYVVSPGARSTTFRRSTTGPTNRRGRRSNRRPTAPPTRPNSPSPTSTRSSRRSSRTRGPGTGSTSRRRSTGRYSSDRWSRTTW
ncbi:hypothetical protein ACFQL4_15590 [Halosimplex aquaticum]